MLTEGGGMWSVMERFDGYSWQMCLSPARSSLPLGKGLTWMNDALWALFHPGKNFFFLSCHPLPPLHFRTPTKIFKMHFTDFFSTAKPLKEEECWKVVKIRLLFRKHFRWSFIERHIIKRLAIFFSLFCLKFISMLLTD